METNKNTEFNQHELINQESTLNIIANTNYGMDGGPFNNKMHMIQDATPKLNECTVPVEVVLEL